MRSIDAVKTLHGWDRRGMYVFSLRNLELVLDERDARLRSTIRRLLKDEVLVRAARGVYVYALSSRVGPYTKYDIASALRLGDYVYESFESAASQWGFVSQIPIDLVTLATTGASGKFETPFGGIELTHVARSGEEIVKRSVSRLPEIPVRIASYSLTLDDMMETKGRCTDLIDWEAVEDDRGSEERFSQLLSR